ncbi:hypothetical protein PCC7424_2243 [Gloeothece citriformis PCC 7424]|uniref:Uncharacterized protein n=1 Tax=Gloeothece citriformis (strain PCC 7424) TaxID=65393 RepID=B7KHH0_GLOC7|nr:hypothetical protein [Gloeothece citriformis]ACK70665.1 hypothetical protein PCC7424_2243 [Gloeothece citriformis PCC 7424]
MKTRETIQIKDTQVIQPSQFVMIVIVMLLSFAVGSIPLILSLTPTKSDPSHPVVPTEAGLWNVMGQ